MISPANSHNIQVSNGAEPSRVTTEDIDMQTATLIYFKMFREEKNRNHVREDLKDLLNAYEAHPNDYDAFHRSYIRILEANKREQERRQTLMADSNSEEGQRYVLEEIQRKKLIEHEKLAREVMPEYLIKMELLYIRLSINDYSMAAIVDSGATTTIINEACLKRIKWHQDMHKSSASRAVGIGGAVPILGGIDVNARIENHTFPMHFNVIKHSRHHSGFILVLLGLDFMGHYRCTIDLKKRVLRFGNGTEAPFIDEKTYKYMMRDFVEVSECDNQDDANCTVSEEHDTTNGNPSTTQRDDKTNSNPSTAQKKVIPRRRKHCIVC